VIAGALDETAQMPDVQSWSVLGPASIVDDMATQKEILVLGANGKTGRRVIDRLRARELPVRAGSRAGAPPFDWDDPGGWPAAFRGVGAIYISYYPDLSVPAAPPAIQALTEAAVKSGVRRLVLLSGRNEPEAQRCEEIVSKAGLEWTVVTCSWFMQNFSEGYLLDPVRANEVALPASNIGEPFIDCDDIADVAAAALAEDRHVGQLYELTGPRLLTFAQAVAEIARAVGRDIRYVEVSMADYEAGLREAQLPPDMIAFIKYLFTEVLDGRSAHVADGVTRALGRPARDFSQYVREAAASGVWSPGQPARPATL
jgi:uncharacterized protein YbjT (DUF2867 family)